MTQATIYFELVSKLQQVSVKLKSRNTSAYSDEEAQKDYDYLSQRLDDLLSIASSHSEAFKSWQVIKSYKASSINYRLKRIVDYLGEQNVQNSIKPSDLSLQQNDYLELSAIFSKIIAILLSSNPDINQLNALVDPDKSSPQLKNIIQTVHNEDLSNFLKGRLWLLSDEALHQLYKLTLSENQLSTNVIILAIQIECKEILDERKELSVNCATKRFDGEAIKNKIYKALTNLDADTLVALKKQSDANNVYELISLGLPVEIVLEELKSKQADADIFNELDLFGLPVEITQEELEPTRCDLLIEYKQLQEKIDKDLSKLSYAKQHPKIKKAYEQLGSLKEAIDLSINNATLTKRELDSFNCIYNGMVQDIVTINHYMAKPLADIRTDIISCLEEKVIDKSKLLQLLDACCLKILQDKSDITSAELAATLRKPEQLLEQLADLELLISTLLLENMQVAANAQRFLEEDGQHNQLHRDIYSEFLVYWNSTQLKAIKDKLNEADESSLSDINKAIKNELNSPRGEQLIAARSLQEHIQSSVDELDKLVTHLQLKIAEFNEYKLFDNLADIVPTVKDMKFTALDEQAKIELAKLKEIKQLKGQLTATSMQIGNDVKSGCMSTEKREQYVLKCRTAFEETIDSEVINTHTSTLYTVLNVLKSLLTKIKAAVIPGNEAQESINKESRYSLFKATHTRSTLEKIKNIPDEPTLDAASNNMPLNKN